MTDAEFREKRKGTYILVDGLSIFRRIGFSDNDIMEAVAALLKDPKFVEQVTTGGVVHVPMEIVAIVLAKNEKKTSKRYE